MPEITNFLRFRETRVTGSGPFKSTPHPKTVCYSPRKRPEMAEIASFLRFIKACYRVPERLNPPRTAKPCAIAHENGQKWPRSRVYFYNFMKVVLRGPGTFKSTSDPKTVCYSPRKRLEMALITSFYDIMKLMLRVPDRLNPP